MSETPKSNTLPDLFDLTGRVAIVTGGAGMLGLRHAEAIAEAGGTPVLADLSPEALEAGVRHLRERTGVDAVAVEVDISSRDGVQAMVADVLDELGRIDILINNAALTVRGGSETLQGYFAPFEDYPLELWQRALDVNLTGTFLVTQAVGRVMVEQRRGVVLNIAAVYGMVSPDHRIYEGILNQYGGQAFNTPISYSATKAAILNFTRYLADVLGRQGHPREQLLARRGFRRARRDLRPQPHLSDPARADGAQGRVQGRDRLPRLRRVVLHDGYQPRGRRRLDELVTP